jgi:hypothetical protein
MEAEEHVTLRVVRSGSSTADYAGVIGMLPMDIASAMGAPTEPQSMVTAINMQTK